MEEKMTFKCPRCGAIYDNDPNPNFSFNQSQSSTIGTSLTKYFNIEPCPNCNGKGQLSNSEQKCLKCSGTGNFCKEIINK
jgi:DnaJ-class molecular chaperone